MDNDVKYNKLLYELKAEISFILREISDRLYDEYRSLAETAYLSRSPKNLKRPLEALNRKEGDNKKYQFSITRSQQKDGVTIYDPFWNGKLDETQMKKFEELLREFKSC